MITEKDISFFSIKNHDNRQDIELVIKGRHIFIETTRPEILKCLLEILDLDEVEKYLDRNIKYVSKP